MNLYTTWGIRWRDPRLSESLPTDRWLSGQFEGDVVKYGVPPMHQHHNRKSHVNGHMDSWIFMRGMMPSPGANKHGVPS